MRRLRATVSCYLALCLALAGVVGVSPALHRLVEHGGRGAAHTHPRGMAHAAPAGDWHEHGDGRAHSHPPARTSAKGLFAHTYQPAGQPLLSFGELWETVVRFLGGGAEDSSEEMPGEDSPGHQHHGLSQLLAEGSLDQPMDVPWCGGVCFTFAVPSPFTDTLLLIPGWDAQTASRGPPVRPS